MQQEVEILHEWKGLMFAYRITTPQDCPCLWISFADASEGWDGWQLSGHSDQGVNEEILRLRARLAALEEVAEAADVAHALLADESEPYEAKVDELWDARDTLRDRLAKLREVES